MTRSGDGSTGRACLPTRSKKWRFRAVPPPACSEIARWRVSSRCSRVRSSRPHVSLEYEGGNYNTQMVSAAGSQVWRRFGFSGTGRALTTDGYYIVPPDIRGSVDTPANVEAVAGDVRVDYVAGSQDGVPEVRPAGRGSQQRDTVDAQLHEPRRYRRPLLGQMESGDLQLARVPHRGAVSRDLLLRSPPTAISSASPPIRRCPRRRSGVRHSGTTGELVEPGRRRGHAVGRGLEHRSSGPDRSDGRRRDAMAGGYVRAVARLTRPMALVRRRPLSVHGRRTNVLQPQRRAHVHSGSRPRSRHRVSRLPGPHIE